MRFAYNPKYVLFKDGFISGLATGADFVAEHEWGIKDILTRFCGGYTDFEDDLVKYQANGNKLEHDSLKAHTFNQKLDQISFSIDPELTWIATCREDLYKRHLKEKVKEHRVSSPFQSVWDGREFLIWSDDVKFNKKFAEFIKKFLDGKVAVGTRNMPMWHNAHARGSCGIHFVDTTRMAYENRKDFDDRDKAYQTKLHLYTVSRHKDIMAAFNAKMQPQYHGIGYLAPERIEKDVVLYFLNPGYGVRADHMGPYTEGQLLRWIDHSCSYQLRKESQG